VVRSRVTLRVRNTDDRPIQVGSHFHFFEVNRALELDRAAAWARRRSVDRCHYGRAIDPDPGGIDSHVHFISPQRAQAALSNGVTTFFGGGIGPTDGTNGTTITSGPWNIHMMLRAVEGLPVNVGLLGKEVIGQARAGRADHGRSGRPEDPRGLGFHGRGDSRGVARSCLQNDWSSNRGGVECVKLASWLASTCWAM
jgi:urease beta subunit